MEDVIEEGSRSLSTDRADQGDLKEVKNMANTRKIQISVKPLMMHPKAQPAGSRHNRFLNRERVRLAKEAFDETASAQSLAQKKGPGDIILGYLAESEGGKEL